MIGDPFSRLGRAVVSADPFPHAVLEEALPPALARTLLAEIPPLDVLTRGAPAGNNQRFTLSSVDALADPRVAESWKSTIRAGLSQDFLDRVLGLFSEHVPGALPGFHEGFGDPRSLRAVQRTPGTSSSSGIALDAQIAVNTPSRTAGTTVRGPHLDRPDKLFVGLLYLRPEGDSSGGADLELYRPLREPPTFGPKRMLPREDVALVRTIPYRTNTLVLFLNTPRSLHGVSPREETPHPRYFLNLVGEMPRPIFEVACGGPAPAPRSLWRRLLGG